MRSALDRPILALAIPALGALAIDPALTLVDTAFIAQLGVADLAALGVDTAIFGVAFWGFNFLAYATTPLVAQALGRRESTLARRLVGDALMLAIGLGVVATVVLELGAPWFVDLMGAEEVVAGPAIEYLRIRALAIPAVLVVTAGHGAFRGYQDTRTPLLVAAGVNGLNLVLDPILIFVFDLGLAGAAVATLIAQVLGAVWFIRLLRARNMAQRPTSLRSSLPTLASLGGSGALISVRTGMLLIAFTYAASSATRIGAEEIAAYQVVMQAWLLAAMIADSFAIAGQAMVGDSVGHRDRGRTDALSVRLVLFWGFVAGLILGVAFLVLRPLLGGMIEDQATTELAISAAFVAAVMMPLAAPLFVADGVFLGLLALGTIILSTSAGAVTAVGLITWTGLGDTLDGIWWALAAMMVVRGVVYLLTYRRAASSALRS